MADEVVKACTGCSKVKAGTEYRRSKKTSSGLHAKCKDCDREYRVKNSERISSNRKAQYESYQKERYAAYGLANADLLKAKQKVRYEANADRLREKARARAAKTRTPARQRASYLTNRAERIAYSKARREENPERAKAIRRRHYLKYREKYIARAKESGAARKGARFRKASAEDLSSRASVFGNLCAYCRVAPFRHWDHVKPISRGGLHFLANLRPACVRCNVRKYDSSPKEWLKKIRPEEPLPLP